MNIKELLKLYITDKFKCLIFEYDVSDAEFISKGYHHVNSKNVEDRIVDILVDYIVFYSFETNEIERDYKKGRLDDMRKAAISAYQNRVPKTERTTDGFFGELSLGAMLKTFFPLVNFTYARVKYLDKIPSKNYKKEVKGYDDISFSIQDGKPAIWIGQVKTGTKKYCFDGIKDDLDKNLLKDYFAHSMLIMADIMRGEDNSELLDLIDEINDIQHDYASNPDLYQHVIDCFKQKNIKINMPSLLIYEDIYPNDSDCQILVDKIKNDINKNMQNFVYRNAEDLNSSVIFMVFAVKDLEKLRTLLYDFRKGDCYGKN